jgi:hypothetical protein
MKTKHKIGPKIRLPALRPLNLGKMLRPLSGRRDLPNFDEFRFQKRTTVQQVMKNS